MLRLRQPFGRLRRLGGVLAALLLAATPSGDAAAFEANERELGQIRQMLEAVEEEKWDWARHLVEDLGEPLLLTYVRWRALRAGEGQGGFDGYRSFLDLHPDWPRMARVQRRAEEAIDEHVPHADRLAFFADRAPLTRQGRVRLAEALKGSEGERARLEALVRRTWIENDFGKGEEDYFLDLFADHLRPEDHVARLDRLLWERRETDAKRMFRFVDAGWEALATARLRLQQMTPGVDRAIAAVPAELKDDPGLAYERLRWRRKKGRDADVREILLDPPDELGRPNVWWYERAYATRTLLDERRFEKAYDVVSRHRQKEGPGYAEAQWLTGWIALRFVGREAEALERFEAMHAAVRTPISQGRAAYWAGRAAAALGDDDLARRWYRQSADHPTTFYGQLAAEALGEPLRLPRIDAVDGHDGRALERRHGAQVRLVTLLCAAGSGDAASPFLEQLLYASEDRDAVMRLAAGCGRPDLSVILAKRGVQAGLLDAIWSYPVPLTHGLLYPSTGEPEPALMLAVARQESHFETGATSPAGALGMMQMMPATARGIARSHGLPFAESRLRYDDEYNLRLGGRYLARLIDRFDGAIALTLAAYNAGPSAVRDWIARHGDPRDMSQADAIDWFELIPYRETRNYVQRVVEARTVYRHLLASGGGQRLEPLGRQGPVVPPPRPAAKPGTRS